MPNARTKTTSRLAAAILWGLLPLTGMTTACSKEPVPAEKKVEEKKEPAKKEPATSGTAANAEGKPAPSKANASKPWPNGARLVVSISMQFETGGQPADAESPFSAHPLPKGTPDLAAESWFRYGALEGIGRLLNLWDKHDVKVTSHIVGDAAVKYPEVAKEIAARGHEIAAHGMTWSPQWNKSYADELKFVKDGVEAVEKVTGQRAVGYNAYWLRRSKNTLKVLQELGFLYSVDDVSRDEPFIVTLRGKGFVVVPYTLRNNDIALIEGRHFSAEQFQEQLRMEFDQLYAEGSKRRRMMSVSLHDRIGGTPAVVRAVDKFLTHAKKKKNVVFMRKDDIAKLVVDDPKTPKDESEAAYNE